MALQPTKQENPFCNKEAAERVFWTRRTSARASSALAGPGNPIHPLTSFYFDPSAAKMLPNRHNSALQLIL